MRIDIRPTPSDQLNGFKAVAGAMVISLSWITPVMSELYAGTQIFVNTTNDFETATQHATVLNSVYDFNAADTLVRYFWIRAVDQWSRAIGPVTGPVSAAPGLVNQANLGPFDLATANIIGKLAAGNVTGLGALALLNELNASSVSGLGYLATRDTISASRVTNLGALATVDQLAANQIGVGQLAAGVIYAGIVNADQLNGGTITGVHMNISGNFRVNGTTGYSQLYTGNLTRCTGSNGDATGLTAFASTSSGTGAAISAVAGTGVAMSVNGAINQTAAAESSNAGIRTNNCIPVTSNTYNCGTLSRPWAGVYSSSAPVVTSDARSKLDIKDTTLGLEFINSLRPVAYRLKVGHNEITHGPEPMGPWIAGDAPEIEVIETPVEGKRVHYGLIAQEVREVLLEHGEDNAAFWALENAEDPDSKQALRYEELIAPMIKAIQQLTSMVEEQALEIATLKSQRQI